MSELPWLTSKACCTFVSQAGISGAAQCQTLLLLTSTREAQSSCLSLLVW